MTRAAIYCRISRDSQDTQLGVDRQKEDCRALADRLGATIVREFTDNDLSASTNSRKPRPDYAEMLRLARSGQIDAILAYSNSRLTRRPRELEDLIDLHAATGVLIKTVVSGDDDLSTADGRMVARIKANVDAAEAERTAERVKRAKRQAAEAGKYRGGMRPYGFNKDGVTIRKVEADVIVRATEAVLQGRSLAAVVNELNGKGKRTSTGAAWTRHSLRDVLLRHRNAGLVASGRRAATSEPVEAVWPAIVEREQFEAVRSMLLDPRRRTSDTTSEPKWLGSGIYVCGRCQGIMRSFSVPRSGRRIPAYRCVEHDHLTIMGAKTDEFVRDVVAERVRDPRVVAAMTAGTLDPMQTDRERRALLVTRLEQTEADYDQDLIDGRRYKAKTEKINEELIEIEARLAEAAQAAAVSPIFSALDPGQAFLDAPLDVQRGVLRSVLRVEVRPFAGRRGEAWSSDRLRLDPVA